MLLNKFEKNREKIEVELKNRLLNKDISNQILVLKKELFIDDKYINQEINEYNLHDCILNNIKFINSNFRNIEFYKCDFKNVVFQNCNFYNEHESIVIFKDNCRFINCKFINCNLKRITFKNISIYDCFFT